MANSRPRGKGVTSIASSAIRLDELLDVYRERVTICVRREKRSRFFFSRQKTTKCALGGGVGAREVVYLPFLEITTLRGPFHYVMPSYACHTNPKSMSVCSSGPPLSNDV
jgi:hypothetical protein